MSKFKTARIALLRLRSEFSVLVIFFIFSMIGCIKSSTRSSITPIFLRCEYSVNPSGIDIKQPSLSWQFETRNPDLRNQKQTAYEILVASSPEILSGGKGNLWKTGLVESGQNTQVIYSGSPLNCGDKCYWKVRVRDVEGNISKWSETATWDMGLFERTDWQGSWIGSRETLDRNPHKKVNGYSSQGASSANVIKWVQVDLGEVTRLDKIVLHPAFPLESPDGQPTIRNPGFGFPLRFRIDISNDPKFGKYKTIVDNTKNDFSNPGSNEVIFKEPGLEARYIRLSATKLWNSKKGDKPYYFSVGELQVFDGDNNIGLNKPASTSDSSEGWGWSVNNLTDGLNLVGEMEKGHEAVFLRKETELKKKIRSAKAYLCGLGYYELYINGKKIGDHVLDPGFSNYSKRVLYDTYDVSEYLTKGQNAIGVILGGGWYDPASPDAWGFNSAPWVGPPKLLLNIIIEFADGTKNILMSDESWKFSNGPIVFNDVRSGEIYDARLEIPGWDLPGFNDTGWEKAKVVPRPSGQLVSQQEPPIRVTKTILPVSLSEPLPGVYVYDMGINMAGWVQFKTRGNSGDTIKIFYNEQLNQDGTVRFGPHAWWTYGAYQTDRFISSGKDPEVFEPHFTYHGFRYVQVDGLKNKPELNDLKGIWVHTDPELAGEFSCSNPDINKIQELIIRTQLNNLHSIPTDCPHREKIGWMGDGLVTMEEAIYNFDMMTFYTKWFHDMMDAQEADGHEPPIVPNPGWNWATSMKNPEGVIPVFSDPWWGGALIVAPWKLYQYYGDERYLEQGYESMKLYMEWIRRHSDHYIFVANLGDWIEPASFSDAKGTPKDQIGTSAYFYFSRLMSQIARLMDRPDDAEKYENLAHKISEAYTEKFFNEETGLYAEDSQTAQVIPLLFNMVPQGKEDIVLKQLINNITNKHNNHLNTGFIGTPLLFQLLTKHGYADLAYTISTQEDQPGWFYMLRNGATTIWEVWDAIAQKDHSRDHPALGSIGAWYYQSLAGIQPDPEGPGFKKIIIKPEVVGDLTWARASYNSVQGKIECNWKREGDNLSIKIKIPVNTSAKVYIPANELKSVLESGKPVEQFTQIKYIRQEGDKYIFEIGSGNYQFASNLR